MDELILPTVEKSEPTVTVTESKIPQEAQKERVTKQRDGFQQTTTRTPTQELEETEAVIIEELPEQITVTKIETNEGKTVKKITKKRTILKKKDGKQERTEIITVQEDDNKPVTTVSVDELEVPVDEVRSLTSKEPKKTEPVEELPEVVTVTETITDEGLPKNKVIKKRIIKKTKDGKQETTEIVTVEEEGQKPVSTVSVEEVELPEELLPLPAEEPKKAEVIEELPEEVTVTESTTDEGETKKKVIKKRIIKKKKDGKQETTEIVTVEEEGHTPICTVSVVEVDLPEEEIPVSPSGELHKEKIINEFPDEITLTEAITNAVQPIKKIIKKHSIKKERSGDHKVIEVDALEEIPKQLKSVELPEDESVTSLITEFGALPSYIQELPEQFETVPIIENGVHKIRKTRKRIIEKRLGRKLETTEIVTVEQDDKHPVTSVSVEVTMLPEETVEYPVSQLVEELPEEQQVIEIDTASGIPKKKITKRKKFLKKIGKVQETTEITTVIEDGKEPENIVTVTVERTDDATQPDENILFVPTLARKEVNEGEDDVVDKLRVEMLKKAIFLPQYSGEQQDELDELEVPETVAENATCTEDIKPTSTTSKISPLELERTIKVKKLKRKKLEKHAAEDKDREEPKKIEEAGIVDDHVIPLSDTVQHPRESKVVVEELPEEIEIVESKTEEDTPITVIRKKRVIKKRRGSKEETTEIHTTEQPGKEPVVTVTVDERPIPETDTKIIKEGEIMEELPETIKVEEMPDDQGNIKRKVTKRRVFKKPKGGDEVETTEITTVEVDNEQPLIKMSVKTSKVSKIPGPVAESTEPLLSEEVKEKQVRPVLGELMKQIKITEVIPQEGKCKELLSVNVWLLGFRLEELKIMNRWSG